MTDAVRPFMKWVGGKKQLLSELDKHVPAQFGEYIEPFVGGGALFFHLSATGRISKATLGDRNKDLIVTYRTVRDEVESLIRALRRYDHRYTKDHATRKLVFYGTRATKVPAYNKVAAAARVIFLNRTCYNGAYRVNLQGGFNVPMGRYANPTICDADNLRACAAALRPTTLDVADFAQTSECARAGDFWYADPPYVPLSASSDFTAYTKEPFGPIEQESVATIARRLKRRGVHVLLSNSDTPLVRKLYKDFAMRRVKARRSINSRSDRRGSVGELLIW